MITVNAVADSFVIIVDNPEDVAAFKQLVHRGANLWPDAPTSIKEFSDQITNDGKLMQNYKFLSNEQKEGDPIKPLFNQQGEKK